MDLVKDLALGGSLLLALLPPEAVEIVGILPIPKNTRELADLLSYFALFLIARIVERWRTRKRTRRLVARVRKLKADLPPCTDENPVPLQ